MNFYKQYDIYKQSVENAIEYYSNKIHCNETLKSSMIYSLKAGGKRIRPVMFLAALDMLGIDHNKYLYLAVAIECVHTYSLIHDDLPALDNDDFRRGKPANHTVYGEAIAIITGDALLNYAFELSLSEVSDEGSFLAVKELALSAGHSGMINGQTYDLLTENGQVSGDNELLLKKIHDDKTGKLLTAPLVMASKIANGKYLNQLTKIGQLTGLLFQFTDDLLDIEGKFENLGKTIGKDGAANKLTAVSVYGPKETKNIIENTFTSIIKILKNIENNSFFIDFYNYIKNREN